MTRLCQILLVGLCFIADTAQAEIIALHHAAFNGDKEAVEALLAKGVDVNAKDDREQTPLHLAVIYGKRMAGERVQKDIVELLLAKGADINAKDENGRTPLLWASIGGDKEDITKLLLAKGADVKASDKDGMTPLHSVAMGNQNDLVELLLAKGADVNASNKDGKTPLHSAAIYQEDMVELLLAKGANINAESLNGDTPLHWAAMTGNLDTARMLVAHGADARARNKSIGLNGVGETPADSAERFIISDPEKQRVMVALLEKAAIASWEQMAGSPRQAFQSLLEQLKRERSNRTLRQAIFDLAEKLQPRPAVPSEAENFQGRAISKFEDANTKAQMLDAASEYLKAIDAAPWVAIYYLHLCKILQTAGRPFEAKCACEIYLMAEPNAEDASDVRVRVAGLGEKVERMPLPDRRSQKRLGWLENYMNR